MANKVSNLWSEAKKIETVTTWLALGKIPMTAQITGVPSATIKQWKVQPWWKELVAEIQNEEDQELDTKLSRVVERSLDAVMERIEGGEFHIDSRTGSVRRVPVKLRDVHRVMVDVIDKRNLIRGKPTSRTEKIGSEDILAKLAGQFAAWVQNNIKQPKVIEGEVLDAVVREVSEGQEEVRRLDETMEIEESGQVESLSKNSLS